MFLLLCNSDGHCWILFILLKLARKSLKQMKWVLLLMYLCYYDLNSYLHHSIPRYQKSKYIFKIHSLFALDIHLLENVELRPTRLYSTIFLAYVWIDPFVQRLPFVFLLSGSAKFRHNGCQSSWWIWTGGTIVNYTHIFTVVM